jgi:hypothetical protein
MGAFTDDVDAQRRDISTGQFYEMKCTDDISPRHALLFTGVSFWPSYPQPSHWRSARH